MQLMKIEFNSRDFIMKAYIESILTHQNLSFEECQLKFQQL